MLKTVQPTKEKTNCLFTPSTRIVLNQFANPTSALIIKLISMLLVVTYRPPAPLLSRVKVRWTKGR